MRKQLFRVLGTLLAVALFAPAGFLFSMGNQQRVELNSSSANWADVSYASHLFNQVQELSGKIEHEVGPIQSEQVNLFWQGQAHRLNEIREHVNQMGNDLHQLSEMRNRLEPWQQQLLDRMTPEIHELAYQTRAAIHELNSQHSDLALYASSYPQYITIISNKSSQLESSIGAFAQAASSAQKLSVLEQKTSVKKTNS